MPGYFWQDLSTILVERTPYLENQIEILYVHFLVGLWNVYYECFWKKFMYFKEAIVYPGAHFINMDELKS